jgi:hypothetical protein
MLLERRYNRATVEEFVNLDVWLKPKSVGYSYTPILLNSNQELALIDCVHVTQVPRCYLISNPDLLSLQPTQMSVREKIPVISQNTFQL